MSNPLGNWLDVSATSNLYISTYVKGFVDMSGGNLILRNSNVYVNSGDISLGGRLLTMGDASLGGNLFVNNNCYLDGDVSMNGNLVVYGNLTVQTGTNQNIVNTTVNNYQLIISEDISLNGRLSVQRDASFGGNLVLTGTGTTGRLGIGNPNPLFPLDISGSMNLSNPSTSATYKNVYGKDAVTTVYPSTISPNTTNASSSTWTNNNVTWTSSASSVLGTTTPIYYAFDNTYTTNYTSLGGTTYSTTAGAYIGNTITTNIIGPTGPATPLSLSGEWLQIQSSIPLTMNSYQLVTPNTAAQLPSKYTITGSTDGNTWYIIQNCSFSVSPGSTGNTLLSGTATISTTSSVNVAIGAATLNITNQSSYSTLPYTYFRMITNAVFATANAFSLCEWLINFTLPSVTGPSNTIMYMDASNINQVDISGSLGLINSNSSSMSVTPCITLPSASTWTNNNILWTASASSSAASYPSYTAFRSPSSFVGTTAIPWVSATAAYTPATGAYSPVTYSTNVVGSSAITGEWIQIQSSQPVYLNGYTIGSQSGSNADMPGSYTILGSNDGSSWYTMHTTTGFTAWPGNLPSGNGTTYPVSQVTAFYPVFSAGTGTINKNQIQQGTYQTTAYTYFRFVIKTLIGTNNFGATTGNGTARAFWGPVFTPQTSSVSLALDNAVPNQLNVGGSLSLCGPISMNYLASSPLMPNQIGYIVISSGNSGLSTTATDIVFWTPPAGVYIFNMSAQLTSPSSRGQIGSTITLYVAGTAISSASKGWNDSINTTYVDTNLSINGYAAVNGNQIVKFTWTSTVNVNISWDAKYIRIA